ncbi:FliG C-terminal domain-containing protein [Buchnera aphidicola]|uniref:FliG C-terminal domain-containing protein n=1 Tax=Buchnera aphidicola TaxID=9 RepID=UPI003463DBC8
MSLNGIEKSAILLMSIGVDLAVKVLKSFTDFEVRKFLKCMVNINKISSLEVNKVLEECIDFVHPINYFSYIHGDYLFLIFSKVLGENEAKIFLEESIGMEDIEERCKKLNSVNANQLFQLIQNEHIQIITAILTYIKEDQAAQTLIFFTEKKRSEIIFRMATFSGLKKCGRIELVKVVDDILNRYEHIINNRMAIKKTSNILSLMDDDHKKLVIDNLFDCNINLTKNILNEMFTFKDLVNFKDEHICYLVNNIELDLICLALCYTNDLLKDKFIKNMSIEDANYLQNKLAEKNTVLISDITNAQTIILKTVRSFLRKEEIITVVSKVK